MFFEGLVQADGGFYDGYRGRAGQASASGRRHQKRLLKIRVLARMTDGVGVVDRQLEPEDGPPMSQEQPVFKTPDGETRQL